MTKEYEKAQIESWISGLSSDYIDGQYEVFLENPSQVESHWRVYFESLNQSGSTEPSHKKVRSLFREHGQNKVSHSATQEAGELWAQLIIDKYRTYGHQYAHTGLLDPSKTRGKTPLTVKSIEPCLPKSGYYFSGRNFKNPQDLIHYLNSIYCRDIGFEFMYVEDENEKNWLTERVESYPNHKLYFKLNYKSDI